MPPPRCTTAIGKTITNANPTVSTPAPILTDAGQRCADTAAEVIATHREARLIFMQGLVRWILREAYREPTSPPSVGIPLAQSVLAGIPSTSRGPYPSFVTYPNYHDGQFHHYYPPNPIPQSPTTSAPTTTQSAGMNASQTTTLTSTTSSTSTTTSASNSNTIPTMARQAHRSHTVFAPMTLVESLTKTNLLLVADMKSEIQSIHNELSTIPFEEIKNEQSQAFDQVNDKIETLEKNFTELKDIVMKRSYQNLKMDPKLLDQWNPSMLVIRRSPWTNMRLILNKVAPDNIADLFPNVWAPKPCFSDILEKHFKVLSEVMTAMFYQCGILQDYDVLAIQGYEQFLKALHQHMVVGNVTINQLGHFLILMTYMSLCRIGHYTAYMREEDAINLEIAVWMSIVIMAFRTSFHAEGAHRTINPYFNVLNTIIRRRLHVILTRYLEHSHDLHVLLQDRTITQSIAFLERQKEANCPCNIHTQKRGPCNIHTQKRGYDWIVFN